MKRRDYCCCAIPMVNAGIYATLIEQFLTGILVGVLSIATPSIVGASTPGFAPWVLGIICFVISGVQILGFFGVSREKPTLYRRYVTIHGLLATAAFSVAAAWIIMSAVRHQNAKAKCLDDFFNGDPNASEGDTLCNIFPWVDVGIMSALWIILAIFHIYLFVVISSYASSQRRDHDEYDRMYDPTQPLTKDSIPLTDRNDPWDSRQSEDLLRADGRDDGKYHHVRQASAVSASDILNEPYQEPSNAYRDYNYSNPYAPYSDQPSVPTYAHVQQPTPTPVATTHTVTQDPRLGWPSQVQAHPAEGHFGRKTPRIVKDNA